MNLGSHPQPTAPWRSLVFRVHCLVTQRWMKIRVPYAWFWTGAREYGNPEIESGTIASTTPRPPATAALARMPVTNDGGQVTEESLAPYIPPRIRPVPTTAEERLAALEEHLSKTSSLAQSAFDHVHPQGHGQ